MTVTAASVWDWTLAVLPFTAIITFLVTLVACNLVSDYGPSGNNLLQISHLATGSAYIYFIVGFIMLLLQVLAIIIGRLQFLLQTQAIINKVLLYISHVITLIPLIFMLIVALVSGGNRSNTHVLITYGIFGSIALYCFLHTIGVFYLYIRRSNGSRYSEVSLPIWFLVCSLLLVVCFIIWLRTNAVISGYLAAATPFLYFLGFVPQFWARAKSRKRYAAVSTIKKMLDG